MSEERQIRRGQMTCYLGWVGDSAQKAFELNARVVIVLERPHALKHQSQHITRKLREVSPPGKRRGHKDDVRHSIRRSAASPDMEELRFKVSL